MDSDGGEVEAEVKPQEQAAHEGPVEDRNEARRARAMQVDRGMDAETAQSAVRSNADNPVPPEWEDIFLKQGDFMDVLQEEENALG